MDDATAGADRADVGRAAASVAAALSRVRDRIAAAGGDPDVVRIVAVTKGHEPRVARAVLLAGLADLGESYAQELVPKATALAAAPPPGAPAPRWHFVGRLQRNKVRALVPHVALWQSVDRSSLAGEVARRAPGAAVLVQVDVAGDPDRGGCPLPEVADLVAACTDLGLDVRGLMAVGPNGPPAQARAGFDAVVALADRLGLAERSLGMSDDLEVAVAAGATTVRVGTALVGPRPPLGSAGDQG